MNILLYNSTKDSNVSPANGKNLNFPALKAEGCESPTFTKKINYYFLRKMIGR